MSRRGVAVTEDCGIRSKLRRDENGGKVVTIAVLLMTVFKLSDFEMIETARTSVTY